MFAPWTRTYREARRKRRDGLTGGFVPTRTDRTAISLFPAWISVSIVYVIRE